MPENHQVSGLLGVLFEIGHHLSLYQKRGHKEAPIAEANIECYLTQWVVGASWYDSMERAVYWFQELHDVCIARSVFA
jgi:hypothetical protein